MMMVGLGEILVVVVLRPLRFLFGGQRTPLGRATLRVEDWLLHHLHVIGAESQMRYELEKQGQVSGILAEGLTDQTGMTQNTGDTLNRMRRDTGATHADALRTNELQDNPNLKRGQRQVESSRGDRSHDIHEAMLQAQREKNQQADRARRHNLRRRR